MFLQKEVGSGPHGASLVAQLVKNPPAMLETLVQFLGREDPLEKRYATHSSILGLPGGSGGKESTCDVGDLGSIPGLERFPWTREELPTPIFFPGESQEQRSLVGYTPWGHTESDTTE